MLKLNEEDGLMYEVPYEPELLTFIHDDECEIRNPFLSECGRFDADPVKDYGFTESWTGGGCKALDKLLPDGGFIRLTDEDGSGLPDPEDVGSALIGRFNAEGEQLACCSISEVLMSGEMDMDDDEAPAPTSRGPGM